MRIYEFLMLEYKKSENCNDIKDFYRCAKIKVHCWPSTFNWCVNDINAQKISNATVFVNRFWLI